MKILIAIGFILFSLRLVAQAGHPIADAGLDSMRRAQIDSLIFSKIPYSANKAKQDIGNGTIQLVVLNAGCQFNSQDDVELVEQRFGFHFVFDFMKYPDKYTEQAETAYNEQMFHYLDSINDRDCEKEISSELARMYFEREVYSRKTDKELAASIRKKLRGERQDIKEAVFEADKHYRDRKFKEAFDEYSEIGLKEIEHGTAAYLVNSRFHCLLNLQRWAEADSLKSMNSKVNPVLK